MAADQTHRRPPPAAERVAGRLSAREPREPTRARAGVATALTELGQIDCAIYSAVAETPTPVLDLPMRLLSRAADRSRLWPGIAVAMAAAGGREGRYTAGAGVVALAVDSAVGHSASGFAFANTVGQTLPLAAAPLRMLASVVGYSGCTPGSTSRRMW